jgi:hypothetical protein
MHSMGVLALLGDRFQIIIWTGSRDWSRRGILVQKHDSDSSSLSLLIMLSPRANGCQPEHFPQSHERPGQLCPHSHHLARRNQLRQ